MHGMLPGEQTNTLRACDELVKAYRRSVRLCNSITLTSCNTRREVLPMNLEEMLGIDLDDPDQRHARDLVEADERMLDELVRIRKERLTQAEVGKQMGISQGAVARIESGERDPHLSTLRRYAFAVGAVITHKVDRVDHGRFKWTDAQLFKTDADLFRLTGAHGGGTPLKVLVLTHVAHDKPIIEWIKPETQAPLRA